MFHLENFIENIYHTRISFFFTNWVSNKSCWNLSTNMSCTNVHEMHTHTHIEAYAQARSLMRD